jgi:hypothetical protein
VILIVDFLLADVAKDTPSEDLQNGVTSHKLQTQFTIIYLPLLLKKMLDD